MVVPQPAQPSPVDFGAAPHLEQLEWKHQCRVMEVGTQLWLALPESQERLTIAGLSGERVGLTHCVADIAEHLSCDIDMVFLMVEAALQPVELLHTKAVW